MGIKRENYGYLFIAPFIIAFLIFGLYPVYNTFYLSFTNTTMMSRDAELGRAAKLPDACSPMTRS